MPVWLEPEIRWQAGEDGRRRIQQARTGGERIAVWPAEPFEPAPTECFRIGRDYWITQEHVGAIWFASDTPVCDAYADPEGDPGWFRHLVLRSWMPAIYQVWGRQVLHASASVYERTGALVAFTGPSGAGKSTFAFGLSRQPGWRQVYDDTLAFQASPTAITLHPIRNDARLRPATAHHYGRSDTRDRATAAELAWPDIPLTLTRIYALVPMSESETPVVIGRLGAGESYRVLLEQAHAFTLAIPEHNHRLMRDYLALAAVPVFSCRYRPDFQVFDQVLSEIEAHALAPIR
jgi:hypothetical protein